jgi:hypothetical protein
MQFLIKGALKYFIHEGYAFSSKMHVYVIFMKTRPIKSYQPVIDYFPTHRSQGAKSTGPGFWAVHRMLNELLNTFIYSSYFSTISWQRPQQLKAVD